MSQINIKNLQEHILTNILSDLTNFKDLSLICDEFYQIICRIHEKNICVNFRDDDLVS